MRILMITPGMLVSQNSGVGYAAGKIAEYLARKYPLTVIQSNQEYQAPEDTYLEQFSVQATIQDIVKTVSSPIYVYQDLKTGDHSVDISSIRTQLNHFTSEVIKESTGSHPSVLYAHDWVSFPAGVQLKKQLGVPLVLHIHSLDVDRISEVHRSWIYDLERDAFEEADAIITVSKYSADRIVKHYRIPPEKIHIIPNGVSLPKEGKTVTRRFNDSLVVFAGRLAEQKGGNRLLEIAESVLRKKPDTRFVLAGDGAMKNDLIELAAHKEIGHRVHFAGQLSQQKLWQLFQEADVFCLPSKSEPFGLAALEAAAMGLPLVLSENSGVAEVLPGVWTYYPNDIEGFARGIEQILNEEIDVSAYTKKNMQAIKQLNWQNTALQVGKIVTSIL